MKKIIIHGFLVATFVLGTAMFTSAFAQEPGAPPPPPEQGQGGNQPPGGGAPIGEGLLILSLLGAGYGTKKWREAKQKA